jgi:drug/metabolite transporter (DMT)-like permease
MTPFSIIPALFVWHWPSLPTIGWFALMGMLGTGAHISLAQAFREVDATVVLPVDFLRLIWSSLLGYMIFGEVPEILVWVGGAVIFGSTAYIAYREARLRKVRPAAVGPPAPS